MATGLPDMSRFESKVAIVTGGGGGIGGAVCNRIAAEGGKVGIFDVDGGAASRVAAAIRNNGGDAHAVAVDITDRDAVAAGVEVVVRELGDISILVNNAGWDLFRPFLETDPDFWHRIIDINLIGALNMHHAVMPGMVEAGYGRIVNVSSDAARVGSTGESVYAACKAGLMGFSKTIAREHARNGITVNVVCPGPTETALFTGYSEGAEHPEKLREAMRRAVPMGRLGVPDDLSGAIAFLASDDAAYVTGQVISVSGGLTMGG